MMAGLFETGGTIDNLFDVVRGDIGQADTSIQAWFHDRLQQATSRSSIQAVLYWYGKGLENGQYGVFNGSSDPEITQMVTWVSSQAKQSPDFTYDVIFGMWSMKDTDTACRNILNGGGGNIFDDFENSGIVNTVGESINKGFSALGFPSLANTAIILVIIGIVVLIIYLKVKR